MAPQPISLTSSRHVFEPFADLASPCLDDSATCAVLQLRTLATCRSRLPFPGGNEVHGIQVGACEQSTWIPHAHMARLACSTDYYSLCLGGRARAKGSRGTPVDVAVLLFMPVGLEFVAESIDAK